jgi:hypothetical protein
MAIDEYLKNKKYPEGRYALKFFSAGSVRASLRLALTLLSGIKLFWL